jgi:hypothetical protein
MDMKEKYLKLEYLYLGEAYIRIGFWPPRNAGCLWQYFVMLIY